MKVLLVFALCGITCCLAVPPCTPAELEKCSQGPPLPHPSEEEELDRVCKETKCWIEIYDRCGTAVFGLKGAFPIKHYKTLIKMVCPKRSPFRREYLDNVKCIRNHTKDFKKLIDMCGIHDDGNRDDFCKIIPAGFRCAVNYVRKSCGDEAGDVFRIAALPGLDPYDCLD